MSLQNGILIREYMLSEEKVICLGYGFIHRCYTQVYQRLVAKYVNIWKLILNRSEKTMVNFLVSYREYCSLRFLCLS